MKDGGHEKKIWSKLKGDGRISTKNSDLLIEKIEMELEKDK